MPHYLKLYNSILVAVLLICPAAFAQEPQTRKVHFNTVDLDANDLITPDEMTTWRKSKFVTRDLNDDNILTRGELTQKAKDGARAMSWEESTAFFMAFDDDNDFKITMIEVQEAIDQSNFFESLDHNGSGTITRHEAAGWLDTSLREKPSQTDAVGGKPEPPTQLIQKQEIEPMKWFLFVDDERFPPHDGNTWHIARNIDQVFTFLTKFGTPDYISFDHNLGNGTPSGFVIAKALVEKDMDQEIDLHESFDFYVHSQNPVGRDNIESYLREYLKFKRQ
jgi:Ca2+-binding EF-hand superfamily protein